jgi:hypothetical protein
MMGAPAGVSQDLQQFTRFLPSSRQDGIRIHTCAAIAQVAKTIAASNGALIPGSGSSTAVSAQLNMTDPAWLVVGGTKISANYVTPVFDLIASAFVRYRVKRAVFHYEPQAAATDGERLVFAFANDPLHPILWNSTPPTSSSLLTVADSIAFMPWRAWSMDVTERLGKEDLYTYSSSSTTVAEFVERFSDFGVMSCVTSSVSQASDLPCGVIYLETEIELMEFCPISVTRPSSLALLRAKAKGHIQASTGPSGAPKAADDCSAQEKITSLREAIQQKQGASSAADDNELEKLRSKLASLEALTRL